MTTLDIGGKKVTVDDSFLSLPPEQQQATVEEIARNIGAQSQEDPGLLQNIDSGVRSFARGVPLIGGAMDEISAGLNTGGGMWGDYDKALEYERSRDQQFDTAHPNISTGLQIGGGIAGTMAGMNTLGVPPVPASLPGKIAAGSALGAGTGAVEGFTRGKEGFRARYADALESGKTGAAIGAAMPIAGAVVGKAWDKLKKPATSGLTTQGLKNAGGDLIEQAKQSDIVLKPQAYGDLIDNIYRKVGPDLVPANMQKLNNSLVELEKMRGSVMPYAELMKLRKIIKSSYDTSNPEQNRLMGIALDTLDEQIDNLPPTAFTGSADPATIASIHKQGREVYARGKNAELVENMVENAKNAVGANYTEAGFQTAIRQQLRALAKDDFKAARWLKPEARAAVLKTIRGESVENFLKKWGKFSMMNTGGMVRSSGLTAAGTYLGGPAVGAAIGTALMGGGTVARPIAEKLTKNNTARLIETLMQGKAIPPGTTSQDLAKLGMLLAPVGATQGAR